MNDVENKSVNNHSNEENQNSPVSNPNQGSENTQKQNPKNRENSSNRPIKDQKILKNRTQKTGRILATATNRDDAGNQTIAINAIIRMLPTETPINLEIIQIMCQGIITALGE